MFSIKKRETSGKKKKDEFLQARNSLQKAILALNLPKTPPSSKIKSKTISKATQKPKTSPISCHYSTSKPTYSFKLIPKDITIYSHNFPKEVLFQKVKFLSKFSSCILRGAIKPRLVLYIQRSALKP